MGARRSLRVSTVHHPTRKGWTGVYVLALRGVTNKYAFQHGVPAENNPSPPYLCCSFVCTPTYWCHSDRAQAGGASHPEYSALHRLCPLGVWRWGVEVFRAPSSGGAQAGGDGGGQVATAVQSAALPFSALHRLCPLAVGGVPVVAVLFVLFAL